MQLRVPPAYARTLPGLFSRHATLILRMDNLHIQRADIIPPTLRSSTHCLTQRPQPNKSNLE